MCIRDRVDAVTTGTDGRVYVPLESGSYYAVETEAGKDVYKRQVLEEYGYKRTAWVLANTLHELKWDGRFGHSNKQWAEHACIPKDINPNSDFVVRSHPAVLDGFVTFYRCV